MKYRITSPDGKAFEVNAPDGASEQDVIAYAQSQWKQPKKETIGDGQGLLRQFANTAAMGFDDELAGAASALTGGDYKSARDSYRREREEYQDENPIKSFIASMTGALAPGGMVAKGVMKGAAMLPQWGQLATIGGVQGAAQGAGDADEGSRLAGAATGGAFGAATGAALPAVIKGAGNAYRGVVGVDDVMPSAGALKEAATKGYTAARDIDLEITPEAMQSAAARIRQSLSDAGYRDYLAPKTFRALAEMESAPGKLADLEGIRRLLSKAGGDLAEKDAVRTAIGQLDDFVHGIGPDDVLRGDANAAMKVLGEARGNYAASKRADLVAEALSKAELQASSAGSGGNIDNAIRQQFKSILNNPKKLRGFSAEEVAMMRQIVAGTKAGNAARLVGKLAPTGIVSGALSSGAGLAAFGGPGAVALPVAGFAGKALGDTSTKRLAAALSQAVRSRAPAAAGIQMPAAPTLSAEKQALIAALLGQTEGTWQVQKSIQRP